MTNIYKIGKVPKSNDIQKIIYYFLRNIFTSYKLRLDYLSEETKKLSCKLIYYISDLHLDEHILDAFTENATESQIKSLIKKIVSSMFCGDFENDVKNFNNPVVLFGGDISSDFSISEFFYKDFINQWKKIERKSYKEKQQLIKDQLDQSKIELDRLIQEYSHWDEITEEWKNKKGAYLKKPLEDYKSLPKKILKAISEKRHLEASISEKKGLISTLSMTLTKKMPTEQNKIFAILGNHEYWDFDNYDDCVSSYSKMFEENKIVFLNSEIARIDAQNGYEKSLGSLQGA